MTARKERDCYSEMPTTREALVVATRADPPGAGPLLLTNTYGGHQAACGALLAVAEE